MDVIISNPPYQLSDGGNGASASPLYHKFVTQAIKLQPNYLAMIIPARWYAGGKGLDDFRNTMLSEKHISTLVDIPNSADCFPGVNVAGGICYFLWDKKHTGKSIIRNLEKGTLVSEAVRALDEYQYFVRNNLAVSIIRKVLARSKKQLSDVVFSRNYFNLPTTIQGSSVAGNGEVRVLTSKGNIYISRNSLSDSQHLLEKYKVIITYAMSGGNKPTSDGNYQILSSLKVLLPNEACTETYLVVDVFDNQSEAENLVGYLAGKFSRFLLLQALTSIHITKDKFCFVPALDFKEEQTDEKLYSEYNLTATEIEYIESMIKEMDLTGGDVN